MKPLLTGLLVLLSFLAVALVQAWPLPLHLSTHVTGTPDGDTGVYIWNTWVFGHELIGRHRNPFSTDVVLALGPSVDLSLHNYTVFADLLTLPLQRSLGIIAAFNLVYLFNFALAGCGMYLLARRVLRATSPWVPEAWLAGLLFACSPFLVARGNGHFSLAAAGALPFFAWAFDRTIERARVWDAACAGACIAWAGYSDPYYAIYCVMLGLALGLAHVAEVRVAPRTPAARFIPWLDVPMLLVVGLVLLVHVVAGGSLRVGSLSISMHTLYTPALLFTVFALTRLLLTLRPRMVWSVPALAPYLAPALVMTGVTSILLGPQLYAIGMRAAAGDMVEVPVLWRSSAPGVDLAALMLPNPNHPLAPRAMVDWIRRQPGENIASIPWVALVVIGAAWWVAGHRPNRSWSLIAVAFLSLSFGPFLRIAGVQTALPTPWTLLRYMPIIGEARMPARFSVLVILALSVLFAGAIAALLQRSGLGRRRLVALVAAALALELLPAPRAVYSATTPSLFSTVANDPRRGALLHLPFGVRDGLTTMGNFRASALLFQTTHHKRLVGGYLSRVSDRQLDQYRQHPVLAPFMAMSEGKETTALDRERARTAALDFTRNVGLNWVVVDLTAASPQLRAFAVEALQLTLRESDGRFELYEPAATRTPGADPATE